LLFAKLEDVKKTIEECGGCVKIDPVHGIAFTVRVGNLKN
jgi:hypothetical protein